MPYLFFSHRGFFKIKRRHRLLIKPCRFHDRVTTKQIIPIFFHRVFQRNSRTCWS
jgi:hypothetical protein